MPRFYNQFTMTILTLAEHILSILAQPALAQGTHNTVAVTGQQAPGAV